MGPVGARRREAVVTALTEAPPQVEWKLGTDMVRRGLPVAPLVIALAAAGWGVDGALSAAYAVVLVLVNLLVSAAVTARAARHSLTMLAAAAAGGFAVRLALVTLAVWAGKDQSWVELVPLGITILITQLGLLWWETRHVSLTLAYPGLKPPSGRS